MNDDRFDALSRLLAQSGTRRTALRALGGTTAAAIGLRHLPTSTLAQSATPAAVIGAEAQAALDALDADTKDSIARALWSLEFDPAAIPADMLAKIVDPKNSSAGFGLRNGAHLLSLIARPTSFVQSNAERYETMLTYSTALSAHQAYVMANLIGPEGANGFPPIPATADFTFPQRNAMDLTSMVGWYFFVGSAHGNDGQEYGIELMFYRYSLLPPDLAATVGLTDVENQVVELHFAVSRAGERHYQAKPILVAGTTGLLSFDTDKLGATMGKNSITSAGAQADANDIYPIRLQAWGQDDGEANPEPFSIDLSFASGKDYLLQGADGCLPCCDGVGTLYYSIPNLQIDPAASSLTLHGETITLTDGAFWFDHQWGMLASLPRHEVMRAAGNLGPAIPYGWDWFMAQFNGDRQITAYSIHSHDYLDFYQQQGLTPPGTMSVPIKAKYVDPQAVASDIQGTLAVTEWTLSVDTPDPVMYPPTSTWYPNRWEFDFGDDVPEDISSFVMVPLVQSGQSGFFANGSQYSEGAVMLLDPAGADLGRGFAESVGYANLGTNPLRLAGIPGTDDMLTLFQAATPEPGLVLASQAFLALNTAELQEISATCIGL